MTDFNSNLAYRNSLTNNTRILSQVIAHEITHQLVKRRLGVRRYVLLPTWKNEGYCEVVSQGLSDDLALQRQIFAETLWQTGNTDAFCS